MLIDSHCHIPHKKYIKSIEDIVAEAKGNDVEKIITVGTSIENNLGVLEIVKEYPDVYGVLGIYPNDELNVPPNKFDELISKLEQQILSSRKIVGIGECGLDITEWKNQRSVEKQILLFEKQIGLALKLNLPIVIHNRNGDDILLEILKKYKNTKLRGVIHCYVSNWEFAQKILDYGFYLSFTGIITYKSGQSIHETVKNIPMDRFLVETDAPYLSPEGFRNNVNESKYVRITAQKVAEIKDLPLEEIEKNTYRNTCILFNLPGKEKNIT